MRVEVLPVSESTEKRGVRGQYGKKRKNEMRPYSFFNALKEAKILNELNSLDFVRVQTVIHFLRILTPFATKMNNVF